MKNIDFMFKKILPLLCGIFLILAEIILLNLLEPLPLLLLTSMIGGALGTFTYIMQKDCNGNFQMTLLAVTFPTLGMLSVFIFSPYTRFAYFIVCLILVNWLSINLPCYITRMAPHKQGSSSCFRTYSTRVSLLFIFTYLAFLGFLLFSDAFAYRTGLRSVNLVPFKTIVPYISGYAHFSLNILIINLLGNVLMFVPLGFYLKAFLKSHKWTLLAIIGIPIMIEVIQYLLASGVSDIDDVILNVLGELLGYWGLVLMNKVYHKLNKSCDDSFLAL